MGTPDKPIECTFYIPLVRNGDRKPHRPRSWQDLEDALFALAAGFTGPEGARSHPIAEGLYRRLTAVRGVYQDRKGSKVEDESWRFIVAVQPGRVDELRALLRKTANTFDQEAIYLAVRGEVEFVVGTEGDGFLRE